MREEYIRPWEKNIRSVVPYVPGEQPREKDVIKLNTNVESLSSCTGSRKGIKKYGYR